MSIRAKLVDLLLYELHLKTQRELAARLEISEAAISKFKRDRPSSGVFEKLERLAKQVINSEIGRILAQIRRELSLPPDTDQSDSELLRLLRERDDAAVIDRISHLGHFNQIAESNTVLLMLSRSRSGTQNLDWQQTEVAFLRKLMEFSGVATRRLLEENDSAKLSSLLGHYLADPGTIDFDINLESFRRLVPARSRFRNLEWPAPYSKGWVIEGSKSFRSLFLGRDKLLDVERYQTYVRNKVDQGSLETRPGVPAHGFYRPTSFLLDRSPDATRILRSRRIELVSGAEHENPSPRIAPYLPVALSGLLQERRLRYNVTVATQDVAPTNLNSVVPIRGKPFAVSVASAILTGVDGYDSRGTFAFDGLSPVAEDGRWLLLRSNHLPKPMLVSILCRTSDDKLLFSFQQPLNLFDSPNWAPTFVGFAWLADFAESENLHLGVERASRRIILTRLPGLSQEQSLNIRSETVGFALDCGMGLMPCYFCMASLPLSEAEFRILYGDLPLRQQPLVKDNPAVSVAEAYSQGRYAEADLLRVSLFSYWRFLIDEVPVPEEVGSAVGSFLG